MPEQHRIVGHARAEALPAGRVGVRVRIRLSGCPSRRWSLDLAARLANELVGHRAVGHVKLNAIVQGDQLVLDGVEEAEAPLLSDALARRGEWVIPRGTVRLRVDGLAAPSHFDEPTVGFLLHPDAGARRKACRWSRPGRGGRT